MYGSKYFLSDALTSLKCHLVWPFDHLFVQKLSRSSSDDEDSPLSNEDDDDDFVFSCKLVIDNLVLGHNALLLSLVTTVAAATAATPVMTTAVAAAAANCLHDENREAFPCIRNGCAVAVPAPASADHHVEYDDRDDAKLEVTCWLRIRSFEARRLHSIFFQNGKLRSNKSSKNETNR
jgi:hypothetical protein